MTSTESGALRARYAATNALIAAAPDMDLAVLRALLEEIHRCAAEPGGVSYAEADAGGRPALWCVPPGAGPDRVILYFHGGGFMLQSIHSHRKLAGHLARAAGIRVLSLDYRQAPENQFPAQVDDAEAAYDWLLGQGILPGHVALAGDSAGAGLAVSATVRIRDRGKPLPAAIIGFSPWFDLECDSPDLDAKADVDALVSRALVEQSAALYLGPTGSPTDPLANPLRAELAGLPPVYLCAGGNEALLDNGARFTERAQRASVDVTFDVVPGQQHVYVFMAGRAPEADETISKAAGWLTPLLGMARVPLTTA